MDYPWEVQDEVELDEMLFRVHSTYCVQNLKTWELGEVRGDILGTVRITVEEVLEVLEWLGPLLFIIYINELNGNVQGMISKSVDDTKISGIVNSEE
eukprot:g42987.t1